MMSPEQWDRTIDFILRSQARSEAWHEKAEARHKEAEARHARAEARQDKLDRRVDGIAKIVQQGMRLMVKLQAEAADARVRQRKMDKILADVGHALAELAQAQKATEQTLRAFIRGQRGSRNGH
jgi:hypothetical protein